MTRAAEPPAAVTAISFLTRLPVDRGRSDARAIGAAAPFFPIAGAALMVVAGTVAHGAASRLPPLLAAALALAFLAVVTGGLHLDGLADTADALGGWSREDRLQIMRDHAIGAFGATALSLTILVEAAAIAALVETGAPLTIYAAVGASSRGVAPVLAAVLPYARPHEAAASATAGFTIRRGLAALVLAAVLSASAGFAGLAAFGAALALTATVGVLIRSWIGGVTGDTLGAVIQLAEAAGLAVALAVA